MGNVNRLEHWREGKAAIYVRPHEVEVTFAGEEDTESTAQVRHLFAAGPIARLHLRLADGRSIDAEISRAQLESMALDEGDEVGVRFRNRRSFRKTER